MRTATRLTSIAVIAALGFTLPVSAGPLRDAMKARMEKKMAAHANEAPATGATEYAYGAHPLQKLDYWRGASSTAPLIIFVHGGGWKRGDKRNATGAAKVEHWRAQGYAVASLNYRLVPDATVEDQAADVASAIDYLHERARELGFAGDRIVLMGHSAGAHLSALVGTDPRYMTARGMRPAMLSGVVLLDGAAYDVPRQMTSGPRMMHETYVAAFGTREARQRALSPTHHAAAPNAADFLILHVEREDGTAQAKALAAALTRAGTTASVRAIAGKGLQGHMEINRLLGTPDYEATGVVDAYLKARLGG